jgi:sugar O-acyltransferase (sialic acid O-acetyltransferase NeuD family)
MLLYGGSGHAKVIISCLRANHITVSAVFDDNPELKALCGIPVIHAYEPGCYPEEQLIIAIGNNSIRKNVMSKIRHSFGRIIHPSALVADSAVIGEGSVVIHNSVVQAEARIGQHCIVNTSATVDHECQLGDFVHISPNATLCGNVWVGEGTHIGTSATVIPGIRIGKWCTIGAGTVVTRNIPDFATAVGIPARIIKMNPRT